MSKLAEHKLKVTEFQKIIPHQAWKYECVFVNDNKFNDMKFAVKSVTYPKLDVEKEVFNFGSTRFTMPIYKTCGELKITFEETDNMDVITYMHTLSNSTNIYGNKKTPITIAITEFFDDGREVTSRYNCVLKEFDEPSFDTTNLGVPMITTATFLAYRGDF